MTAPALEQPLKRLNCKLATSVAEDDDFTVIAFAPSVLCDGPTDQTAPCLKLLYSGYQKLFTVSPPEANEGIGAGLTFWLLEMKNGADFGIVVSDGQDRVALFEGYQNNRIDTPTIFIAMGTSRRALDVLPAVLAMVL